MESAETDRAWQAISLFTSHEVVRQQAKRHRGPLSAGQVAKVAAHFTQAREYFENAKRSGDLSRPLLLYYGVLGLARGLITLKNASHSFQPGHGLNGEDLERSLLKQAVIKVRPKGTFSEFCTLTKNLERPTVLSLLNRPISVPQEGTSMVVNASFVVKDILARVPDLRDLYRETFVAQPLCYQAEVQLNDLQPSYLRPRFVLLPSEEGRLPSQRAVQRTLGLGSEYKFDHLVRSAPNGHISVLRAEVPSGQKVTRASLAPIRNDGRSNTFLVAPLPGSVILSTASLLYLLSYTTGMLARYTPERWAAILHGGRGDRLGPLLKASVDLVARRFPALIAAELMP